MLLVFSFCHKDAALALKQAQWVRQLGGVNEFDALVVCNAEARRQKLHEPIADALSSVCNFVDTFSPRDEVETGWPQSPNHMWVRTVQHILVYKQDVPFLWMEPDAVPIVTTWAQQVRTQFQSCGKSFMGDWVQVDGILPHMSGVGVYHRTAFVTPPFACVDKTAWDVALALLIEPHFHRTKLIQHEWKPDSFATAEDLNRIRPEAVIYHQCKDGSLIDRLIESRGGVTVTRPVVHLGENAGANPAPATSHEVDDLKSEIERLKALIKPPRAPKKNGVRMKRTPMTAEKRMAASERAKKMWETRKKARA